MRACARRCGARSGESPFLAPRSRARYLASRGTPRAGVHAYTARDTATRTIGEIAVIGGPLCGWWYWYRLLEWGW